MGRRSTPTRTNPRNRRLSSAELKVQVDLLNPIFHDDNAAREYLEGILWPNGPHLPTVRGDWTTLMSAFASSGQVNSWLSFKHLLQALQGKAGGTTVMTTVDHTLMRGLEPHDR